MRLKFLAASFFILSTAVPGWAASVKLAWDPVTDPTVVGYKVHYGTKPGKYSQTIRVEGRLNTKAEVINLEEGKTYFFAITSIDLMGRESAYSPEITNNPNSTGKKPHHGKSGNRTSKGQASKNISQSLENAATAGQAPTSPKIPPAKSFPSTPEGKIPPSR